MNKNFKTRKVIFVEYIAFTLLSNTKNGLSRCCFKIFFSEMPIGVSGGTFSFSYDKESKLHTFFFVRKPYLRTNYNGIYIEEDIDMETYFRF